MDPIAIHLIKISEKISLVFAGQRARGSQCETMENFHVYDQIIGSDRADTAATSAVYKARRKKTLVYVAVKRVDKSQRSIIDHTVRILTQLGHHPNLLTFHQWFERKSALAYLVK